MSNTTQWHHFCARQSHHASSHEQQWVSESPIPLQESHYVSFHRLWVTQHLVWATKLINFVLHNSFHQSVSECSLPGSLINLNVSCHNQQSVNYTSLFLCQSHQSCLIPWPSGCEWHCCMCLSSLISHVSSHDKQFVSDTAFFVCHAV